MSCPVTEPSMTVVSVVSGETRGIFLLLNISVGRSSMLELQCSRHYPARQWLEEARLIWGGCYAGTLGLPPPPPLLSLIINTRKEKFIICQYFTSHYPPHTSHLTNLTSSQSAVQLVLDSLELNWRNDIADTDSQSTRPALAPCNCALPVHRNQPLAKIQPAVLQSKAGRNSDVLGLSWLSHPGLASLC